MDLLFQRYTAPFQLIDQMILAGCFSSFIRDLLHFTQEEKLWAFYLHKVADMSYEDFKRSLSGQKEMSKSDLETTVLKAYQLVHGLNEGGEAYGA